MHTKEKVVNIFYKAYCLFCKSNSEGLIAERINELENIKAIAPVRVLQERVKKRWIERERPLIPGYIFIYVSGGLSFDKLIRYTGAYKFLEYHTGNRELYGPDYEYAAWVYRNHGKIKPSRVLTEGDTIEVIDGPLKESIGTITRLDRHKRRAWVEFDFYGKTHKVSLSVIDINPQEIIK